MQSRRFFFYRATPTVDDGKKNRTFRANGSHLALAFSPFAPLIDPDRHKKPYPGVEREKERWFKGEKSERGEHLALDDINGRPIPPPDAFSLSFSRARSGLDALSRSLALSFSSHQRVGTLSLSPAQGNREQRRRRKRKDAAPH